MTFRGRLLAAAVILGVGGALCGCALINKVSPRQRAAQQHAQAVQHLQLSVMRFADEYVGRTNEVLSRFILTDLTPEQRLAVQDWKVQQATEAYTVASGPDPVGNALDMVVLCTLSRMVLDDAWVGGTFGVRAKPVQETYHQLEAESRQLLSSVLSAEQMQRLEEIITRWRAEHPNVRAVASIHFRDFAEELGAPGAGEVQARGNLFSMLGLDPFKDLDPAIREITQTRELAERSIYYMQRVPTLLDMQVELLTYQLAVMPETRQVLSDVDRVSVVGSASDRVARTLPELLDKQREALVAQLLRLLNVESSNLGSLAGELRATLDAGTGTAKALHGALQSVEHITAAFAPQPGAPPPKEPRSPFDIRQYTEMLKQATITAQQLEALTQRADAALPVVRSLTAEAASRLDQVLDRLFILLLLLVFAAAAAVLLAALAYRRIVARFARSDVVAARGG